jgi:predicted protein tyrosine phosphatase
VYNNVLLELKMIKRNQLGVLFNAYQGKHKKVLTVCSAGCLRSPTAAHILSSEPFNFNTRCAGTSSEYAIIPVTEALVVWADVILCMDSDQQRYINEMQNKLAAEASAMFEYDYKAVINLEIEDDYAYRDPELVKIMQDKFYKMFEADLRIPTV